MNELDVLIKTHDYLVNNNIWEKPVMRLYTDAHRTLLSQKSLKPFQRFTLDMTDFVVHPDLVGQVSDGETLFAVEAKGDTDLIKGLAQAEIYQYGFNCSFIAADSRALGNVFIDIAKRKNVGVIAVDKKVDILFLPEIRMPLRDKYQFISKQMDSVIHISNKQTYHFNLPTHYLVWAIILEPNESYSIREILNASEKLWHGYQMPREWRSTLSGAEKMHVVRVYGDNLELTEVGKAVKQILPTSLYGWSSIHSQLINKKSNKTLEDYYPKYAAILRILLLQDPMVRLIIDGLKCFKGQTATFDQLAKASDQLDHARAPIFFFKPESLENLLNNRGRIVWEKVRVTDYRSTMFKQYKSILKHAGILKPTKLGDASGKIYNPENDVWALK